MKKYMSGVYMDLHFVALLNEDNKYICISEYSKGNRTDMTFMADKPQYKVKYYDTLDDALVSKMKHRRMQQGLREDRLIRSGIFY